MDAKLKDLPHDRESLEAILRALILERDEHSKRANDLQVESLRQKKRADELHLENLRLQLELERYKKWRYGPRGDRLATSADVAQALLEFAEQLETKPIHPEDVPAQAEPDSDSELRRVKRRPGRRHLANFENLPVTTRVYELSAEERICLGQRRRAPRDWCGRELADRAHSWALRAHSAHPQKVCLSGMRESGRESADGSGREARGGDR